MKETIYIGEGGEYDGWIFLDSSCGGVQILYYQEGFAFGLLSELYRFNFVYTRLVKIGEL